MPWARKLTINFSVLSSKKASLKITTAHATNWDRIWSQAPGFLLTFPMIDEVPWADDVTDRGKEACWPMQGMSLLPSSCDGQRGQIRTEEGSAETARVSLGNTGSQRHSIRARIKSRELRGFLWVKCVALLSLSFEKIPSQTHWERTMVEFIFKLQVPLAAPKDPSNLSQKFHFYFCVHHLFM